MKKTIIYKLKSDEEILKTYFDFYCTLMHIACNMYNVYRFNTGWGITLWLFLPHDYFTDVYKSLDSWSNHLLWTLYIFAGASAASNALRNSGGSGDSPDSEEMDPGDGVSNQLVLRY